MGADTQLLAGLVALPVAGAWWFTVVLLDCRNAQRAGHRIFVPDKGVLTGRAASRRSRNARAGAGFAAACGVLALYRLLAAAPGTWSAALLALCAGCLGAALMAEQYLHRKRSTLLCTAVLAVVVTAGETIVALGGQPGTAVRVLAAIGVAQMYLVSAIRKAWSVPFRSGQVLLDEVVLSCFQAAAGNTDFIRLISPRRLSRALSTGLAQRSCAWLAKLTIAIEMLLGLGVLGLLPATAVFALAVLTHASFAVLSPRRITPFSVSAVALVALAIGW
ncbi:hypothetical protein [Streptomyces pacificus]|uniref:Uncharacterized protein n=1 Tax=Streptomyces pacificus TaxID=2705029 RepID=A0A6A0AWI0_9ACTN|nr:hypothetical protein [Streptomyces pacificus]GFH35937.1 hypothetical protein SCWH03_21590 [Streptomyces pacificus]